MAVREAATDATVIHFPRRPGHSLNGQGGAFLKANNMRILPLALLLSRPRRCRARCGGDRRVALRGRGAGAGHPARGPVGRGDRRGVDGVTGARQTARRRASCADEGFQAVAGAAGEDTSGMHQE